MSSGNGQNRFYDDSVRIVNYTGYDQEAYLKWAVPFDIPDRVRSILDDPILPCEDGIDLHETISNISEKIGKNAYLLSADKYNIVSDLLLKHYRCIRTKLINAPEIHRFLHPHVTKKARYMLKLVDTPTYRYMFTSLKEVLMQDKIYGSEWEEFKGSDITTKPILCSPLWDGKRWKCAIVCEYAVGETLHVFRKFPRKIFWYRQYNKDTVMQILKNVVKTLWCLGYAHNDLSDYNIIFDKNTNDVKIIDFESCVQLPDDVVNEFRKEMRKGAKSIEAFYEKYYKYQSLSLLYISEQICCRFAGTDRCIFNTDDNLLKEAQRVL